MSNTELFAPPAHEVYAINDIKIVLYDDLDQRISAGVFSAADLDAWPRERGLPAAANDPLIINIHRQASDHDPDSGIVKHGGFWRDPGSGQAIVNLYIGHYLNEFDRTKSELDVVTRQNNFNDSLNHSLVHEIEHYLEDSRGEPIELARDLLIVQEIGDLVLRLPEAATMADDRLQQEVAQFMAKIASQNTFDDYLRQPHEIRARQASQDYAKNHGPMIWLTLTPS